MVNRAPVIHRRPHRDLIRVSGWSLRGVDHDGDRSSTTRRTSATPVQVLLARSDRARPRGWLVCDILDYEPWEPPVPLKNADGEYFETDPSVWTNGRVYWAQGVRRILEDRYDLILAAASAAAP